MSFFARYFSNRLRRPTRSSKPRRLWWSCLCTLRCSVRSLIRRVSNATWTSGEPVSPSVVACSAMISLVTAVSSGTWLLKIKLSVWPVPAPSAARQDAIRGISVLGPPFYEGPRGHWPPEISGPGWSLGPPHEGAADPAGASQQRLTVPRCASPGGRPPGAPRMRSAPARWYLADTPATRRAQGPARWAGNDRLAVTLELVEFGVGGLGYG